MATLKLLGSLQRHWADLADYLALQTARMTIHHWMLVAGAMVAMGVLFLRSSSCRH